MNLNTGEQAWISKMQNIPI